jgi:small-conductance mechanosensitive channel
MSYRRRQWRALKWVFLAISTLSALRLFFVREVIAAVIIFCLVFACLAVVLTVTVLMGHVVDTAVLRASASVNAFGNLAQRSWENAEAIPLGERLTSLAGIHTRQSNHQ